ncbi:multifunctional transcriptional regulator/nicotinamide-nucleotide adenylyltransferase/ribosylnicotinamide kinase NadR [Leptotrichia buccalis]|jgi:cytidyltransferase-like domain protein|uniref:Cytidyltransferase-related domain protein n=1 Tax=Leptotrichia buccalis (strain ATCC 14201 / DSM 1135 / JCM 12969 / NCTC 10249 / C-1013-b) TaxID=523794 RepID=C7NCF3_LEPBD|nr:multifunctional transcriptional regulator/nicotinamide-nucleotide adenylyltransferase/ribosylnicotinamide kinase NadR [Leptotrichia buccalis]ACV39799.1 cytidyltransferase-related domain protein [Leptotrichia buccalis C-1013-b]
MKKIGIVIGKFFPLHIGHVNLIQRASGIVDRLYVVISYSDDADDLLTSNSRFVKEITPKDRLRFVKQTFKNQPNISSFLLDENNYSQKGENWEEWARTLKNEIEKREKLKNKNEIDWKNDVIFISNRNGDEEYNLKHFGSETKSIDKNYIEYNVNSKKIRENPSKYWDFLPREVREHLIPIITICGGESSGKSVMIDKLANVFNTTSAWEYGREYVFEKLGGDEEALQYSDYEKIVFGHQSNVLYAARNANKFALIDTDYIATLAFCLTYEKRDNPIVREFVQNYRFDLTILLENNVAWVNDGLRSIGDNDRRERFQNLLKQLYKEYDIPYIIVKSDSYEKRYLACKHIIKSYLDGADNVQLQNIADSYT